MRGKWRCMEGRGIRMAVWGQTISLILGVPLRDGSLLAGLLEALLEKPVIIWEEAVLGLDSGVE